MRTVSQKMGVKEGARAYVKNAPEAAVKALALPDVDLAKRLSGKFDFLLLFVTRASQFTRAFLQLKKHLAPRGSLWVAWPRGGQLGTDLNVKNVIKLGYDCGLVESTNLRVDDTWTALKFTHPKAGKTYANSYGTLPGARPVGP
ncbi:MAG: hypothetical protein ACO1OB_01185 [Archangium sp.]